MADEPEDDEIGEVEIAEATDPDWYEVEGGYIILPHGAQWYAETFDAAAIRILMAKGGEIEVQDVLTGKWRKPSQGRPSAELRAIKGGK